MTTLSDGRQVADVYIAGGGMKGGYVSAGPGQFGLAVGTATKLTPPAGASLAQICVEGANVRYRDDGVNASATLGIPVSAGSCFQYGGDLTAINFTAQSGSPTLDVLYYK